MNYHTILYNVADNILTLSLNRPDHLNAFTVEMAEELIHAFNRASDDDDVRVIVVTGSGRAFCAGMDLSEDGNVFGLNENLSPTMEDMNTRLASEHARIGFVFNRIGITPEACSSWFLPRIVGISLVGLGPFLSASRVHSFSAVHSVICMRTYIANRSMYSQEC